MNRAQTRPIDLRPAPLLLAAIALLALLAVPRAADASWVVRGGGFGHGVGMGAYGAFGFGKNGVGYKKIIRHYYAKTRVKRIKRNPEVTVLLQVEPGDVRFKKATRACGRNLRPGRTYRAARKGSGIRLESSTGKKLARCGKRLSARRKAKGPLVIKGLGKYRGALKVVPTSSSASSLNVINKLPVESYTRGSIPAEVPPSWPRETLRVFAVAIRSIALSTDVGGNGFDLYSDTRTQVYKGVAVEDKRSNQAVRDTARQVAKHDGEIIQTVYSSATGGRTESRFLGGPSVPYFKSVKDPYDHFSPLHRWKFTFSNAEMNARLGAHVPGKLKQIRGIKRGDSPRIESAKLVGTAGSNRIRGDTLQYALGLYDRWMYFKKMRGRAPARSSASAPPPAGSTAPGDVGIAMPGSTGGTRPGLLGQR